MIAIDFQPRSAVLVAVLLTAAAGCHRAPVAAPEDEHPVAPVQAEPARTTVMGEWTDLLGTTQPLPDRVARVSTAVEAHVVAVLGDGAGARVSEGQHVRVGQVIVKLDDRVPRATRTKLQATLDDFDEQEKQAGFALELASIDVNRLENLRRENAGSQQLVSQVELQKARVLQLDARSKQKAVADRRTAARADLKALDEQLEFYTLRAPISGRLGVVQAVPGQTVAPGAVVADVIDLGEIDVLCYAPPASAARLKPGQPARLVRDESGKTEDRPRTGTVVYVAASAQPETGNVPVKVRFPNPRELLRAYSVVRVDVLTQPEGDHLTVPEDAVAEDRDAPTVVAVKDVKAENKDGEVRRAGKAWILQATVGLRDRGRGVVELLGLEDPATKATVKPDGLLFITAGGTGLRNDDPVTVQPATDGGKDDEAKPGGAGGGDAKSEEAK